MNEFELIRRYFPASPIDSRLRLSIGDDCALLAVPNDEVLAVTTDTLVAGRHFPIATAPADIGWKALAVNLSDLAAMGAQPRWFQLALTLAQADADWLAEFARGLHELAQRFGAVLTGGDTTRGPLSITITAMGMVPEALALRRDGAQVGDVVCVTGTLGDAALALRQLLEQGHENGPEDGQGSGPENGQIIDPSLRERLDRPLPRVAEGLALRGLAHAALDLSDGLAGDLRHILAASSVGADIDLEALPMSAAFKRSHAPEQRWQLQLAGGDDYELCVCLAPDNLPAAQRACVAGGVPLTPIGRITAAPGVRWYHHGRPQPLKLEGYQHF